jgi:plasmid maintenance system antidote protein VapI
MALRLSKAFKTTPKMWINLKTNYELWAAEQLDSGWKDIEPLQIRRRHRRSPQRPRKQDK